MQLEKCEEIKKEDTYIHHLFYLSYHPAKKPTGFYILKAFIMLKHSLDVCSNSTMSPLRADPMVSIAFAQILRKY